jgi:Protein of unknown function (DUF1254)
MKGNAEIGVVANQTFGVLDTKPRHVIFTPNSDTPYGPIPVDLSIGPVVIELQPGPLIVVAIDVNQRWVADMGLPGPDAGKGGKHLLIPPEFKGEIPEGYMVHHSTTNQLLIGARSLPVNGDVKGAMDRLRTIKVHPLHSPAGWKEPEWVDLTDKAQYTTPVKWEMNLKYWEVLAEVINIEPAFEPYRAYYGELAVLGIVKGKPFAPDDLSSSKSPGLQLFHRAERGPGNCLDPIGASPAMRLCALHTSFATFRPACAHAARSHDGCEPANAIHSRCAGCQAGSLRCAFDEAARLARTMPGALFAGFGTKHGRSLS